MAFFKKTLVHRLLSVSRSQNATSSRAKSSLMQSLIPPDQSNRSIAPDPGESRLFRTVLQRRSSTATSAASAAAKLRFPTGESLIEKLRGMDIARDRIKLDGLIPPPPLPENLPEPEVAAEEGLTASSNEKKVLLRATQMGAMRAKLREIQKDWISYSEFVEICTENCSRVKERGVVMVRLLEDSGAVIVLGNSVCLHPDEVVKAIQGLIPLPLNPNDPRRKELEEMEKKKHKIDRRAESLVRRELWGGLVYLVAQTATFMRLTFWELSWDVMEPICFYVTSFYFMAGYAFFLRTSKEPSFEGFFQSRFSSRQKQLMQAKGFDLDRYNELRRACGLPIKTSPSTTSFGARDYLGRSIGFGSGTEV